ncbi:hypothetical protein MMC09_004117 [Bachmanniomyces sp. S44760]|nr:hypothetical protein [Bachmanniomyces sp. S44760]
MLQYWLLPLLFSTTLATPIQSNDGLVKRVTKEETQCIAYAKKFADEKFPGKKASVKLAVPQGTRSATVVITLEGVTGPPPDGTIIQCKEEADNEAVKATKKANEIHGDLVPLIEYVTTLSGPKSFVYKSRNLVGQVMGTLLKSKASDSAIRQQAVKTMASFLAKGAQKPDTAEQQKVGTFLQAMEKALDQHAAAFSSDKAMLGNLKTGLKAMTEREQGLKEYPQIYMHSDLNGKNVIADTSGKITGIIDWDGQTLGWSPLGDGFYALPYLFAGSMETQLKTLFFNSLQQAIVQAHSAHFQKDDLEVYKTYKLCAGALSKFEKNPKNIAAWASCAKRPLCQKTNPGQLGVLTNFIPEYSGSSS